MFNDPRLTMCVEAHEIEAGAISQIAQVLGVKVLDKLVIFPDVHQGYDIPIGSVALVDGYIWPGAVGVDINCGMAHINTGKYLTDFGLASIHSKKPFLEELKKAVPLINGANSIFPRADFPNSIGDKDLYRSAMKYAFTQIGTLGSGNHFVSIGVNSEHEVGLTLHTGSRNPGNVIGTYWMNRAKIDGKNFNGLYMYDVDSELGKAYYNDMLWAFDFATDNRITIMKNVLSLLNLNYDDYKEDMIHETHNHAVITDTGVLHRKGATPAEKGIKGVIPGNMRDGIFITEGLGNEDYLSSASHGAGRKMSRGAAKRAIVYQDVKDELDAMGITVDLTLKNCDESPDAYKDIFEVIDKQNDVVVKVIDHFKPVVVHIG